ncbi:MAG: hypothetical protein H6Q74_3054 [Firmicutes bacterium]|nr:hypothetical protein [Bacillota bacterium]
MNERSRKMSLMVTILLLSLLPVESGQLVMPVLGELSKEFPTADGALIGLVMVLPMAGMILFNLVGGTLSIKMDKKKLLTWGMALYIIGGVGPAFATNIYFIILMRAVIGIGAGICAPLAMGLIAEFFDGNEKATLMGLSIAVSSIGGALLAFIGGYVALWSWRYTFAVYGFAIIVLALQLYVLPEMKPTAKPEIKEIKPGTVQKPKYSTAFYILTAIAVCQCAFGFVVVQKLPIFIMNENFGDPMIIGSIVSAQMICGFIGGLIFGPIYKILKNNTLPALMLIGAISFFVLGLAQSLTMIFVSQAIFGFMNAMCGPYFNNHITALVPETHKTFAVGFMNAACAISGLISPFIISIIVLITRNDAPRFLFSLVGVVFVLLVIGSAVFAKATTKNNSQSTPSGIAQ